MKTALEILMKKVKEAEANKAKGLLCDENLYIIQAMEEYASQFQQPNKEVSDEDIRNLLLLHQLTGPSGFGSIFKELRSLFSNTKTVEQDKWISVKVDPPNEYSKIIAFFNNEVAEAFYCNKTFYWQQTRDEINGVTHWQPLPPAPGEKGGKNG